MEARIPPEITRPMACFCSLAYINWYINSYGRPRTSSDLNLKMRFDLDNQQVVAGEAACATTDHMANIHVPSADPYPRRGNGRKGAFGVAMR